MRRGDLDALLVTSKPRSNPGRADATLEHRMRPSPLFGRARGPTHTPARGALLAGWLLLGTLLPACAGPEVRHYPSPGTALGALPFSEAVRVGDLLLVSGQIGNRPGTLELVAGGIEAETRQTLDNVRAVLERHGSSLDRVVKCTVFLADIAEWPAMNAVYRTYFTDAPPARSAACANGLALGARVEIEAIAVVGGAR
jgi:reactive intermediate/imine deaminase